MSSLVALTSATSTGGSHRHSQQLRNWLQRSTTRFPGRDAKPAITDRLRQNLQSVQCDHCCCKSHEEHRRTKHAQSVTVMARLIQARTVAIPPACNHNVRPTRRKGHANLVEEHHRPALTALLPAAGQDATDQCRCDLLRGFEKVLRIWFCFEPF